MAAAESTLHCGKWLNVASVEGHGAAPGGGGSDTATTAAAAASAPPSAAGLAALAAFSALRDAATIFIVPQDRLSDLVCGTLTDSSEGSPLGGLPAAELQVLLSCRADYSKTSQIFQVINRLLSRV
jgi:hypothetical protein